VFGNTRCRAPPQPSYWSCSDCRIGAAHVEWRQSEVCPLRTPGAVFRSARSQICLFQRAAHFTRCRAWRSRRMAFVAFAIDRLAPRPTPGRNVHGVRNAVGRGCLRRRWRQC
jgi:hypothetical protein